MTHNTRQLGMFWVMFTLAVAMIPQIASMPAQLLPIIFLPMLWRLLAELRGWKPVPMWIRVGVTILAVLFLMITYGGLMGRRAAVGLLTLMLSLKLLETFKTRDARIVASLSLFLCGTQFLFSQGIPMIIYTVVVMISALVSLTMLQRREAFAPRGIAPRSGHSIFSELGYSSKLLLMSVPAAFVIFMLFPRWGGPLWGVPEAALDAKTGLSGSMTPGSIQNLFMDDSPAFRAEFDSPIPPSRELYWRGPVFWDFDGRQWATSFYSRNLLAETRPAITTNSIRYTVQIEPTEQHWLFALDYPASTPRRTRLTMDYQLLSFRSVTSLRSYDMVSNPDFVDTPRLRSTLRSAALNLPEGFNPRTWDLIRRWREETPSDVDMINRVLKWFNDEAFFYTLNPPLLSTHSVDEFIFDSRSGFCEHYASAFTVMMRMAGIPARVVTGYQGGWYNSIGNYVLVRQSDAHAWSEVWLPGSGWTRIDPTAAVAPGRVERGALNALSARRFMFDYEWIRNFKNGFDLLQRRWNDWVIAFSRDHQSRLLQPFGLEELTAQKLTWFLIIAVVLVGIAMMPLILRVKIRSSLDPAAQQWSRFRKKLEDAGIRTSAAMTPGEVVKQAWDMEHADAKTVHRISRLYRDIRYAPGGPGIDELEKAIREFQPSRKAG